MQRALILYASKSGTTRKAAESLSRALESDCDLYDLREGALYTLGGVHKRQPMLALDLSAYRAVALGSAMYMGRPVKPYLRFCEKRCADLLLQPLFLFTCGIASAQEEQTYLWPLLPEPLTKHAGQFLHLGGELRADGGFMQRMVLKEYAKKNTAAPALDALAIARLAELLK